MNTLKRISQVFASAEEIPFDDSSKIILMSDIHRGDGSWADDFSRNQYLYFAALTHYYQENYTYIEIGDGDELWENKKMEDIIAMHSHVFWLLAKFYKEGRIHFLFGNHDMVKRKEAFARNYLDFYWEEREKKHLPLFPKVHFHEGLILKHRSTGQKIFLIHGHQASYLDYDIWRITSFLVRYLWRPLELIGVNDPTSTAKNHKKKEAVERKLTEWVSRENQLLIAGHTHRPMFPEPGQPPYFNDGSVVHPRCITGLEIVNGSIALIKWSVRTRDDGTMFIGRELLAGPQKLQDYMS